MAESLKPRSPHTPSYIPVIAPRPTRSNLPSSLSLPQFQLAPPPRRPSGSSPAVAASPVSPQPVSGISSFRSLRNLLPFGAAKPQPLPNVLNSTTNGSKSSFPNFGSVRRSMTGDRKNSATFTPAEDVDPSPVISIEASPQHTDTDTDYDPPAYDSRSSSVDHINFSPASRRSSDARPPAPSASPGPPIGDLSTIIEAETSGISKHIPNLDELQELGLRTNKPSSSPPSTQATFVGGKTSSTLHPDNSFIDLNAGDTSGLDLSTSKLTAEVLDAMMAKDVLTAHDWLKGVDGVVVDGDIAQSPPKIFNGERDNNLSFSFGSLDPDLAALLSPNRAGKKDQAMLGIKPSLAPSPSIRSPSTSPGKSVQPPSRGLTRTAPPRSSSPVPSQPPDGYFPPASYPTEAESSPARRRSASLTRSTPSHRPASLSALPRLARSVTASVAPVQQGKSVTGPGSSSQHSSPEVDENGRRASADHIRRRQPPSPLSSNAHASGPHHSVTDLYTHRQLRLVTPSRRTASHSTASNSRPPLRQITTASSTPRDADSTITFSRASSSVGAAGSTSRRRLHHPRPNTDEGRTVTDPDRTFQHRARKRSMSLHQNEVSPESTSHYQTPLPPTRPSSAMSARRPAAEWLGPRTAKAFAAAGLLDHDKAGRGNANGASRYGLGKGVTEQDPRAQYNAPSRMAFSEASGSTSSWGRSRSVSRTLTMSEAGGASTESPTYSLSPRTAFSGGSTAPTSISASSSITQSSLNVTVQSMREKHSVETEALLSALSDSQRTTKMLREENMELRARVQELEGKLNHMRRRSASPQPPAKLARMVYQRLSQSSLESGAPKRSQSHVQTQFLHPNPDGISPSVTPERGTSPNPFKEIPSSQRRRLSTTSSNFHLPPSNMSLLMHEADLAQRSEGFSSRSVSPPSPTLVLPNRNSTLRHAHKRSMSSGGNISPMTANFSMTGSPGSLHLRPEHEMHLGDMASLDMAMVDDESGEDDGL